LEYLGHGPRSRGDNAQYASAQDHSCHQLPQVRRFADPLGRLADHLGEYEDGDEDQEEVRGRGTLLLPQGAFGGVPTPGSETAPEGTAIATPVIPTPTDEGAAEEEGTTVATATGTPTPVSTDTPTPTWTPSPTLTPSSTPTPTPTPTATPTPSLTPTPIEGDTAVVDSDGANVWLYRSPGGQELVLVSHGDTVILLSRRANQGGVLWREVMTLQGLSGWLQAQYLPEP
jgi:hypothetical protein